MLDVLRRGQRWWTALVVVFVGGVFAVFIGLGGPLQGPGGGGAVVVVGPYQMGIAEFERDRAQREEQFREALGEAYDARQMRDTLDGVTAQALVQRGILALEAERLGLTVAKEEVEREILSSPGFRDENGRFDRENFSRWVSYEFGSEKAFREQQQRAVLASKLVRVIQAQSAVSEGEARGALELSREAVRIAYTVHDAAALPDDFELEETAIDAFLVERDAEARALYDERAEEYDVPEQTRARHILLRLPAESNEEIEQEVKAKAQGALDRVNGGEDFAAVAEELSGDPGSAANGGDLGFFKRGQMVPEFEEVAFTLEPGTTSDLVRTSYGFHIIRVEERREAEHRSYEDVRADLAHELLGREEARLRARATAESLAQAVREGVSLEQAARDAELTLERSDWLRRRPDGFVPGLGAAPELMAVAFTLEPGQSSARVFEVGDQLALVQVLERQEPDPAEIEMALDDERERLRNEKLGTLLESWVAQRRDELLAEGQLAVNLELVGR